jgi:hypothetical protein
MEAAAVDRNLFWTGAVCFLGLVLLHVVWWQALVVAAIMSACWYFSYGQRILRVTGLFVLILGLATWTHLLPDPWPLSLIAMQR